MYLEQAGCEFLQLLLQLRTHLAKPFTLLVLQLQLLGAAGRRLSALPSPGSISPAWCEALAHQLTSPVAANLWYFSPCTR